ncbi:MAG: NAD-dependent epimerase/dehydratase family protein [Elusimicrobia bacterium]|nr:NAD-dependent epimerase/dehydratase family protein [Elusimicrobiota bacterium]
MRIFVTGATGYIGRAVAEALRRRGHRVSGLTRSTAKAKSLAAAEIEPVIGDMRDARAWERAAWSSEILVHCAVEYSAEYEALDRKTVDALLGIGGRVLYTSGVWQYGPGGPFVESSAGAPLMPWRSEHEKLVLAAKGLVIRPGCVYGGTGGLTGLWFQGAVERKAAPIVGDGANRWAVVHVQDLADVYVRAAEGGLAGELLNAVDASRFTVREMAEAASRAAGAGGTVKALSFPEAEKAYGGMAHGLALDQRVDASKAGRLLGWAPRFNGFPPDADLFFASWNAFR